MYTHTLRLLFTIPRCSIPRLGLYLAGVFLLSVSAESAALVDRQGMLQVDGRPLLILGMYENPKDDAELAEAVRCGFNLFQCAPETAALDRLQRAGAKGWVNLGGALDLSTNADQRTVQLARVVERVGKHPALLVWEGPDEILWNQWWAPMETLRAELRTMRNLTSAEGGLPSSGAGGSAQMELSSLASQAQMNLERGLYPEFHQVRDEFWRRAGKPCPNPDVRVDDAPGRVRSVGEGITAGIQEVRRLDAHHVIWLNHAPRNSIADLRWFNRAADMAGCDIYPVPANLEVGHSDLTDMSLSSVGAYTRRMREAAPGRACAMVLQGFGWRDLRETVSEHQQALGIGRRPTFSESRFMAYDALLHGANAILYWGTAHMKPVEDNGSATTGRPRLWQDLLRLGRELRALEPALVAQPEDGLVVATAPTFGSHDRPALVTSLRWVGEEAVLIVANESGNGLRFAVERLPSKLNGRTLYRLGSSEEHRIAGTRLEDGIKGTEVHVYATSRSFEPTTP